MSYISRKTSMQIQYSMSIMQKYVNHRVAVSFKDLTFYTSIRWNNKYELYLIAFEMEWPCYNELHFVFFSYDKFKKFFCWIVNKHGVLLLLFFFMIIQVNVFTIFRNAQKLQNTIEVT